MPRPDVRPLHAYARQVVYDAAVHGWTLQWQDLARRPAVANDRPVALDPFRRWTPSYFDLQCDAE